MAWDEGMDDFVALIASQGFVGTVFRYPFPNTTGAVTVLAP